jgi:hypothetical protein
MTIGLSLSSFIAANEQRIKTRRAINGLKILKYVRMDREHDGTIRETRAKSETGPGTTGL